MKALRVFEKMNFERGDDPQRNLRVGKYKSNIKTFKDHNGETQTIEVIDNSFKLYDLEVKLVFKFEDELEDTEIAEVYVDGEKNGYTVFKMCPFDYEFKEQGKYSDPGFTSYGYPIAKNPEHLKELKEKYAYWRTMSGDYSRETKDPFIGVAQMILFTY